MESLVRMLRVHPSASHLLLAGEKLHGEASMAATEAALEVLRAAAASTPGRPARSRAARCGPG